MTFSPNFMFLTIGCLTLLLPCIALVNEKPNEYTQFDYCTLNCGITLHSACKCAKTPPRVELENLPYVEFRKMVLDEHNRWRNYIASGQEKRPEGGWTPSAGNMLVMSYDLEMEYIIRCRAVTYFRHNEDDITDRWTCRITHDEKRVGQNVYGFSSNDTEMMIPESLQNWYEEVTLLDTPAIIEKYQPGGGWHHFTQLVWWSADRVGCAWVYNPRNKQSWRYAFLCNYASTITPNTPGNEHGEEVYKKTPIQCDSCPEGRKCGETLEYPALCGKQEPIPDDAPALIPIGSAGRIATRKVNKYVECSIIVVLYLLY